MATDLESHIVETRTARIVLREDGVVQVTIRGGVVQSLADARDNLTGAIALTGGDRRPLLVDIRSSEPLEPAARHHYRGPRVVESFSALGMLIEASSFGRMLGNIYLRVARLDIPTRLFVTEREAVAWLVDHVD